MHPRIALVWPKYICRLYDVAFRRLDSLCVYTHYTKALTHTESVSVPIAHSTGRLVMELAASAHFQSLRFCTDAEDLLSASLTNSWKILRLQAQEPQPENQQEEKSK